MQGMIDLVQKGFFPKGSKVLYAHLGGAPALTAIAIHSATVKGYRRRRPDKLGKNEAAVIAAASRLPAQR